MLRLHEVVETTVRQRRAVGPVVLAVVALAGLDLVGAALARHWSDHRSAIAMTGGIVTFAVLFVVYARSLDYAELSTVTIGWVVLLQVGVVAFDRLNGVAISPARFTIIAAILVLQMMLTLSDLSK
jgi:hypothetical protein